MATPVYTVDDIIITTTQHITQHNASSASTRPYITLTYAQSINGAIAGRDKSQLKLSGSQSMHMTHRLRSVHNAILVGCGTVLHDNCILSTRLPDQPDAPSPHPIIIDTHCTLIQHDGESRYRIFTRKPTIITACSQSHASVQRLQSLGCTAITAPYDNTGKHMDLRAAMKQLTQYRSLMIEGGSMIISNMLTQYSDCVDQVIVTIAPMYVHGGLNVLSTATNDGQSKLCDVKYAAAGNDVVMHARMNMDTTNSTSR